MTSIKAIAETPEFNFLPSTHPYFENQNGLESVNEEDSIPTIDFSLLTMGSPDQRSKVIHDLGKACQEWGFFLVINHGLPEGLAKGVFDAADEFFNLKDEEKKEFEAKLPLAPISCGNSFHNADKKKIFLWRDYLKVISHPDFHFPKKPLGFRVVPGDRWPRPLPRAPIELAFEYCKKSREVAMELMKGVMESLGIEETEMKKALNLESGLQMFVVNVADQLEIFSNGKYKSVMHRAIVNDKIKRLSIAMPHGPSLDNCGSVF
ncbi:hypothetical protein LguiB_006274 [Lonicera macranthoides]